MSYRMYKIDYKVTCHNLLGKFVTNNDKEKSFLFIYSDHTYIIKNKSWIFTTAYESNSTIVDRTM